MKQAGRRAALRGPGLAKATKARNAPAAPKREALSRHGEETIFAVAEHMSEGQVRALGGTESYFGSTMLTVPLDRLRARWSGALRPADLAALLDGSVRVHLRAMRLACADATRRFPDRRFGVPTVETRVTLADGAIHIDVDLEAPLDPGED